jgi:phosphonate transport system substrate-binding protein
VAQVELRSGRLHISGFAAGATVYGVNLGGFHPVAMMGNKNGTFGGYRLWLITHKDSDIKTIRDLKGRKVAHVTPASNSGDQAPRALFKKEGIVPDADYKVIYSGKHDNSIMGVVNKDYDAAPVASTVMDRMIERKMFERSASEYLGADQFPGSARDIYNLHPDLQKGGVYLTSTERYGWPGVRNASSSDRLHEAPGDHPHHPEARRVTPWTL